MRPAGPRAAASTPRVAERRRQVVRDRGRRRRSGAMFVVVTAAAVLGLYWLLTGPLLAIQNVAVTRLRPERPRRAGRARCRTPRARGRCSRRRSAPSRPRRTGSRGSPRSRWPATGPAASRSTWWRRGPVAAAASRAGAVLVSEQGRVLGPVTANAGRGLAAGDRDARRPWGSACRTPARAPPWPSWPRPARRWAGASASCASTAPARSSGRLTNGPELRLGRARAAGRQGPRAGARARRPAHRRAAGRQPTSISPSRRTRPWAETTSRRQVEGGVESLDR